METVAGSKFDKVIVPALYYSNDSYRREKQGAAMHRPDHALFNDLFEIWSFVSDIWACFN